MTEPLVSEPRRLVCSRCAQAWSYSRTACAACGETEAAKRPLYAEDGGDRFPHLSIDACLSCRRYLIDVDLGRDRDAVPEVDELAALPLDLYAVDQGLTKITPNIMGF
jgi:FdhE protein